MTETSYHPRVFDWKPRFDPRSRDYPMRAMLPPTETSLAQRRLVYWKPGEILDQGNEGACVGFGWTQEALTSPVRVKIHDMARVLFVAEEANSVAHSIYQAAKKIDEWDGENYEGTSVLAGAKEMQARGFIREYRWCFDVADVIGTLLHHGPVVLGINWHQSMYHPDMYGELRADGPVVGGHCIVANGYHPEKRLHPSSGLPPRPMVHLTNSWGLSWGQNGGAWLTVDALSGLLAAGGEACVPVHRSYGDGETPRKATA